MILGAVQGAADHVARAVPDALTPGDRALTLRTADGPCHLAFRSPGAAPAMLTPDDPHFELRAASGVRAWRWLSGRRPGPPPRPWRLTPQQTMHLVLALRALDGRLAGASQRDIARVLFGERIVGRAWVGSGLQSRTKRALAAGLALSNGGWSRLLAPPRRGAADETP